jgi:hypothetical protein
VICASGGTAAMIIVRAPEHPRLPPATITQARTATPVVTTARSAFP